MNLATPKRIFRIAPGGDEVFSKAESLSGPRATAEAADIIITEEAAITWPDRDPPRVVTLVAEGAPAAQGAPVLALRDAPAIRLVAPMAATVARISHAPGHRLSEATFFADPGRGRHEHIRPGADCPASDLRQFLQGAGLWPQFRSRPHGRMPGEAEIADAIFVIATDTRPGAPRPTLAISGREEAFSRGLETLLALTAGPVFLCLGTDDRLPADLPRNDRIRPLHARPVHPLGLAGFFILRAFPAGPGRQVWDVAAEDVAAIGEVLATGLVPETRLVSVSGAALERPGTLRCQPGADLRALTWRHLRPGPHRLLTGSALDGRPARWLGLRDRQASVEATPAGDASRHWLFSALRRASRPLPLIPTAAMDQALGGVVPGPPLLRAIAAGDRETAVRLGALSLLGEDLALVDYATAATPRLSDLLEVLLETIAVEEAA